MSDTQPDVSVPPFEDVSAPDVRDANIEIIRVPPEVSDSPLDVRDSNINVMSAPSVVSDSPPDVIIPPGSNNSPSVSENDSTSDDSSDDDSFRTHFPGQISKKVSFEEITENDSFSEKIQKARRTASEEEILYIPITEKKIIFY